MRQYLLLLTFSALVVSCHEDASAHLTDTSDQQASEERDLSNDPEVWVTVDSDVLPAFAQHLISLKTGAAYSVAGVRAGVTALRLRESQLGTLGMVVHDTFHRCGGFEMHDTEEAALAALTPAPIAQAAPMTYTIDNAAVVQPLLNSLGSSNILTTVNKLSSYKNRYYNSQTGADSANWLKSHWQTLAQGRTDVTVETFAHSWLQPSVILTITGTTSPSEVVVLGAHLDSINQSNSAGTAPGADDDASGVATLTEVIRSLMANDFHPARTVKFMGYAAEEVGLRGSKEIAAKHKADGVNVVGVMQLDMTNYKGSDSDIVIFTDYTSSTQNTFVGNLVDTYVKVPRATSSCGYACSDHASWNSNGYATSMPFESLMSDYNPSIHTANDTLAQSGGSADHSLKFAKLAAAFVGELAKGTLGGTTNTDTTPPTVALTAPTTGQVNGTVAVTASATDNVAVAKVDFTLDGAIVATDTTSPYSFDWNTTSIANGTHTLSATATDSSGNTAQGGNVVVTVANAGNAVAVYDSTRKAPACAANALGCDSGSLLNGRGSVGPEVNKPNTLKASCADGASGKYHVDESVDRIVIASTDGSVLTHGQTAKISVTIWAYSSFASDKVEVYQADDAANPTWKLVATLAPTAAGAQTLTTNATLTTGKTQAIRARIRYKGTAGSCGTGSYDDHDDLVFTVQ